MGRKKPQPQQMGAQEREQREWNMLDSTSNSTSDPTPNFNLVIIDDNDRTLALEREAAEKELKLEEGKGRVNCSSTAGKGQVSNESSAHPQNSHGHSCKDGEDMIPDDIRQFFRRPEMQENIRKNEWSIRVPLYSREHSRWQEIENNWHWEAGKFIIQLKDHDGLTMNPQVAQHLSCMKQCWLYFSCENDSKPMIYYEVYDEVLERENKAKILEERASRRVQSPYVASIKRNQTVENRLGLYWYTDVEMADVWTFFLKLSRSGQKKFQLVFGDFSSTGKQLEVTVYGRKETLQKLSYPSQGFVLREVNQCLIEVMNHFYNLGPVYKKGLQSIHQDFQELYAGVKALQRVQPVSIDIDVQHPSLKPKLRPYQQDAVRWMLKQERFGEENDLDTADGDDDLHPMYTEVKTRCGKTLFYNRQGGSLVLEKPKKIASPPGGILADEMGLGKTVEVLCCMLLHPRPPVPHPPRLLTLMEMESTSSESSEEDTFVSTSLSKDEIPAEDTTEEIQVKLESSTKAESDNFAVSSDPSVSQCDSFIVTEDQSCPVQAASKNDEKQGVDSELDVAGLSAVTTSASDAPCTSPKEREDLNSLSQNGQKRQLSSEHTEAMAVEEQSENSCDSNTEDTAQCSRPKKKKTELHDVTKEIKEEVPTVSGEKRTFSVSTDGEDGSEQQRPQKKVKTKRLSRFFEYISEEQYFELCAKKTKLMRREPKFECVCGKGEMDAEPNRSCKNRKQKHTVKCTECGTSQHAECMNYDLEDPFRGLYKCPHCHYNGRPIPSGATLIVSPFSIAHQWNDEIKKHIWEKSIKVFVYNGVSNQGYIQPQTLASQDIVITTYETLRRELNYVDLPHTNSENGRRLRKPKKFMTKPTPLTSVDWWRICLDEAQMVECVTTKTAEMALRLTCVNRWCVTGTPLNQSIKDLFGLLAFIAYDPYHVEEWWTKWLYEPYLQGIKEPMFETLAKVMWRNSMEEVKDQLNLPNKSEEIYHLTFSPVEDIFYRQIYSTCAGEVMASSFRLTEEEKLTKLGKLDRGTLAKYLRPLRKLRQACCHPQAVRGSFIAVQESILTMEELLENLIKKSTVECMDSHRSMIASMNGQAGIYLLQDEPKVAEAVAMYRAVLNSVEVNEKQHQFKTDVLPQVHALHNLREVLSTNPPGVGQTLRDDLLGEQCEELKEQYLRKTRSAVTALREQLAPLQQTVRELTQQLSQDKHWFLKVLTHANQAGNGEELANKVYEDVTTVKRDAYQNFHNVAGLQYIIMIYLDELETAREKMMKGMRQLRKLKFSDQAVLDEAVNCCLRTGDDSLAVQGICMFCKLSDDFLRLESKLFGITILQKTMAAREQIYRQGHWGDSILELMLKSLLSYARNHRLSNDIVQNGSLHINLLDAWKKEFKQLRALWVRLKEEANAVDELIMAISRLRLRLPEEEMPEGVWRMNICEKTELGSMLQKFQSDQRIYAGELRTRCGQLEYLRSLAQGKRGEFQDGINPEECPICKEKLGRNWSVLLCGHCSCMSCIQILITKSTTGRNHDVAIRCMICRKKTKTGEISYVSTSRAAACDSVKGSHSTKIKAVVQRVLDIQQEEPDSKILVFATWIDVLKLIGKALYDNDIKYTHLHDHGRKFEKSVTQFKEDKDIKVLLLPYQTGSKGLNLFEASHVILVEPILSPSQEDQAIGRVFRMGQTRPTKIHRLLVKHTIEERIHSMMESTIRPAADGTDTDTNIMTVGQLISLFEKEEEKDEYDDSDSEETASQEESTLNTEQPTVSGSSCSGVASCSRFPTEPAA